MALGLNDGTIATGDRVLVRGVAQTLSVDGEPDDRALFLRARAAESNTRHKFGLGRIPELRRYTVCHRYEPYWMRPRAGTQLSDVPPETQYFLGELNDGHYLLLVPLIGELFRFSLQSNKLGELELLAETGDPKSFGIEDRALLLATGPDPFVLLEQSARLLAPTPRRDKPLPDFVDQFGWCTWDAFYQEVSADKVREGLERFAQGGVSPRFLILDDGWQSVKRMPTGEKRLTAFAANDKFEGGLSASVELAKKQFGVETFLVWHAVVGYWGGVDGASLPGYGVVDQLRYFGEGVLHHAPSFNQDWWGSLVGFVPAADIGRFYDDYHGYLKAQGVDGVKVDSQAVLEALAYGQGGRVPLTAAYRRGLEASVAKHFDGRLINCMSNAQETWYGSERSTVLRTSIDFFPRMPETHGSHLYTNAQVGLWFGEFMHPDWDMFQSGHEWGAFHAAGRAISGGPVYVSDKPGEHDFALLNKLVCKDGKVLRCDRPGLPTLDNLCVDPTRGEVLLKIWNRNGSAGIVGVFNAHWHPNGSITSIAGGVTPSDVYDLPGARFACYAHNAGTLEVLERNEQKPVSLETREFELFTFVPIENGLAAIGLLDKFNSAGAIAALGWSNPKTCQLTLKDAGTLLCYCETAPSKVEQDGGALDFKYDAASGALRIELAGTPPRTVRLGW